MKQAMIFAAGLGTRLKPITDTMPKALVKVDGDPLLKHVVIRLRDAGYTHIVVNVHHFANQIIEYLRENNNFGINILISDETEKLLETGGGIKKAIPLFCDDSPVLIHNVDILGNVDYGWFSRQHLSDEDAVLLVSRRKTQRYLLFDNAMRLMGWINIVTGEIKSPYEWVRNPDDATLSIDDYTLTVMWGGNTTTLFLYAFSGIHSLSPRLFPLMDKFPEKFPIMDFYLQTCHRTKIYGCQHDNLKILDVGKMGSIEQAEQMLKGLSADISK